MYNIYYKAKLKRELPPSRKKKSFLAATLSFFFLLSFLACILDHRIM